MFGLAGLSGNGAPGFDGLCGLAGFLGLIGFIGLNELTGLVGLSSSGAPGLNGLVGLAGFLVCVLLACVHVSGPRPRHRGTHLIPAGAVTVDATVSFTVIRCVAVPAFMHTSVTENVLVKANECGNVLAGTPSANIIIGNPSQLSA